MGSTPRVSSFRALRLPGLVGSLGIRLDRRRSVDVGARSTSDQPQPSHSRRHPQWQKICMSATQISVADFSYSGGAAAAAVSHDARERARSTRSIDHRSFR